MRRGRVTAIPVLTDPKTHGFSGPGFDVVVPSLPEYGYCERSALTPVSYAATARLFCELMESLGYEPFGAGGGDFGSGVAAHMALQAPERLIGLHHTNIEIGPEHNADQPWTDAERAFYADRDEWDATERGYLEIQSTKPQALGYGLAVSPAGLAGWLIEKWRSWTDSGGDPVARLGNEFLATLLTICWATGSITTAIRDYHDNRWHGEGLVPDAYVQVPTAFDHQHVKEAEPPRSRVERLYNVQRRTEMPAGGTSHPPKNLFGVGGGDFGSGIAAHLELQAPQRLVGLHLTNIEIGPQHEGTRHRASSDRPASIASAASSISRSRLLASTVSPS